MPKRKKTLDLELAAEAKSIVALAFRNGPIEDLHAGKQCPTCSGESEYSHITQAEMKHLSKEMVSALYRLFWLRKNDPEKYQTEIEFGKRYTRLWDEPEMKVG